MLSSSKFATNGRHTLIFILRIEDLGKLPMHLSRRSIVSSAQSWPFFVRLSRDGVPEASDLLSPCGSEAWIPALTRASTFPLSATSARRLALWTPSARGNFQDCQC